MQLLLHWVTLLTLCLSTALAVKSELFKKCDQSGFCHRNRHFANEISNSKNSYYAIDLDTVVFNEATVTGDIHKKLNQSHSIKLPFQIDTLESDNIRLRIDEDRSQIEWHNKLLRKERFAETWKYAFEGEPAANPNYQITELKEGGFSITYGIESQFTADIYSDPFKIIVSYKGEEQVVLNDRSFLNIEHFRTEEQIEHSLLPEESNFYSFKDGFEDSAADSLPYGPESVALDFTFKGFKHVYGIPEHADAISLKDTTKSEPYRLYNVDIFEYEVDSRLPMYGAIPLLHARKAGLSAGVFWVNAADTYVDIKKEEDDTKTHWISENGIIDVVILISETPSGINKNYAALTGTTSLPQLFSLGYHQCRWNYNDEKDVLDITANMDLHEIPYDTIWLDVEYTDAKKYFTWQKELFPDPQRMLNKLDETGRTLVAIIDPHIKTGYEVSKDLESNKIALLNKDGDNFKGHCWPGESYWIDTFNPKSQEYWTYLFRNGTEFAGDATNFHIWNDMNEPSVFSGPETTTPKDVVTHGDVEIRSDHNIYGLTYHEATYEALKSRYVNKRPFVLTRSFFSGSQRTAAMWTGDNMSKWEYLKLSIPMVLTQNIVGMPFSGADIGGFFGDPSWDLLTRWYQAGIWYPFFRAHAHIDSRRREPWIPGEPYTSVIREAIKLRYSLLPLFYTKFYESSLNGGAVIEPLFFEYPSLPEVFDIDDEFFVGGLLVKPVTEEGVDSIKVYLPDDEVYFDYFTHQKIQGKGDHEIETPLDKIPVLIKGGSITPRKDRYRRSSKLMKYDPYTLVIAVGEDGTAHGHLYVDDGETFQFKKGEFLYIDLSFKDGVISSTLESGSFETAVKVGKIVVLGYQSSSDMATMKQDQEWSAMIEKTQAGFIVKNPGVVISKSWTCVL